MGHFSNKVISSTGHARCIVIIEMFGSWPSDSRSSDGGEEETWSEEGKKEIPVVSDGMLLVDDHGYNRCVIGSKDNTSRQITDGQCGTN